MPNTLAGTSRVSPCPLCKSNATIESDLFGDNSLVMVRVKCPACRKYQIAAALIAMIEAGKVPGHRLAYVAAASGRSGRAGKGLRIESQAELMSIATAEARRQQIGDLP